jgi:predicted homoserine dehydrogenase-like protein
MNLHRMLRARADRGQPIRIGVIGAGKFGTMFLAQLLRTPGMHLVGVADLAPERARDSLLKVGAAPDRLAAKSWTEALDRGTTHIGDDALGLIATAGLDVVVEATGVPAAGIRHALAAIEHGKHIIMVNVEADVLAGPLLARRAAQAGIVYGMAYGDQPALIAELVDWARASGFDVVAAGKGTKYLPAFHASTPDTVWGHYGLSPEQAALGGMNPQMFNSFLDGTKSGLEMAAVANATGLIPSPDGVGFPACGVDDLPRLLKPKSEGGLLHHKGQVEVISSLERDGRPVFRDLRWGVYVVFEAPTDYVVRCFAEYGMVTDPSGRYAALYRPYHLIGLEVGISVAAAALRGEASGSSDAFHGDVVAVAKRPLAAGEMLDGEGGFTVWGRLMPAEASLAKGALPIGLAHKVKLTRAIAEGEIVGWADVVIDESAEPVRIRREMERLFAVTALPHAAD